jgi:uncharacterized membrane protein
MMATAAPTTAPLDAVTYAPPKRQRVDSIDLLRGLVMVIMLLDHTRDYFSAAAFQFDPTDLTKTSVALFFTRWITHFCAPTFFFLAGTGAYLRAARGATPAEMSRFLVSRGLWLIFLELTIIRFGISGDFLPHGTYVTQTIWALGWSMIVLAALVHLPLRAIGVFSLAMILVHNAFDGIHVANCLPGQPQCGAGDVAIRALHVSGPIFFGGKGIFVLALYPLIPWIGVMAAGYVFGKLYTLDAATRRRALIRLGGGIIALFIVLRATNLYGDPARWSVQPRGFAFTVLSFLNTTKYPPSLLYLCMTIGPGILLLAFMEREGRGRLGSALVTYGRVPMLFYMLQWLYAHGTAFIVWNLAGMNTTALHVLQNTPPEALKNVGFSLPVVYAFWLLGVLLIYPLCKWFAGVKKRRSDWWLSYL